MIGKAPTIIEREILWATVVETYKLPFGERFNDKMTKKILLEEKRRGASSLSQSGEFPPFSSLYKQQGLLTWGGEEALRLASALKEAATKYLSGLSFNWGVERVDLWANVHREGNWHGPHSHFRGGPETISGVYWVNVPEEKSEAEEHGALVFLDSRGPYHPGRFKKIVRPAAGHAILFPSWQQHYVTPVARGCVRVSVGFDVLCSQIIP